MSGKGKIISPCNSDEQTITVYSLPRKTIVAKCIFGMILALSVENWIWTDDYHSDTTGLMLELFSYVCSWLVAVRDEFKTMSSKIIMLRRDHSWLDSNLLLDMFKKF